jgi:hypothetical protein
MFAVNKRYLSDDSFTSPSRVENPFEPTQADEQILLDKDPDHRVLNLTTDVFNDATTSYFHKSIGGYHGAKLRRYQELFDYGIRSDIRAFVRTMSTDSTPVLNMLNTRYFILPDNEKRPFVYRNINALGNAWFVKAVRVVDNADAEIKAVTQDFRPDSVVIVNREFEAILGSFAGNRDSSDFIALKQYAPNSLLYSYRAKNDVLAVFSEIYYPKGWKAYIDGKFAPHFRANYVLRAMVLPAGTHEVRFRFEPVVYTAGEKISLVSSAVLILLALGFAVQQILAFRKRSA